MNVKNVIARSKNFAHNDMDLLRVIQSSEFFVDYKDRHEVPFTPVEYGCSFFFQLFDDDNWELHAALNFKAHVEMRDFTLGVGPSCKRHDNGLPYYANDITHIKNKDRIVSGEEFGFTFITAIKTKPSWLTEDLMMPPLEIHPHD